MNAEQDPLHKARQWETQALAQIYDQYSPGLYRYALRLLGDPSAAEDCVAETFRRFLQALQEDHGPRDYLQAYLYRIAHNLITDHYRRQPLEELEDHLPDGGEPIEEIASRRKAAVLFITSNMKP